MIIRRTALLLTLAGLMFASFVLGLPQTAAADPVVVLETSRGDVKIRLADKVAPNHAQRIATLAGQGFYDGVVFHRVIDGFMAQTGDPTGTGSGGSELPDLKAEFSKMSFSRGMVGMARSRSPNSANSQFFIMFADAPHLDGQYTIIGEVISGMDVVDNLKKGDSGQNGTVSNPDSIVRARVEGQ
ncbi:MAG: peptidylprolyl isomerase [Alphaproteobacteria bacterium]